MSAKQFVQEFALIFVAAFFASVLVTFLYSLIAHGAGVIDWETSIRNGILLGIVFPLSGVMIKRRK